MEYPPGGLGAGCQLTYSTHLPPLFFQKIMIHYHGSPLSGSTDQQTEFYRNRHVLLSWATFCPNHVPITEVCSSFCIDNGAYSFWGKNIPVQWQDFYNFLDKWIHHPRFDFFLIPDVIDGAPQLNDDLVHICRYPEHGVPIFHVGEPLERLEKFLEKGFKRIAIGTTKGYELKSLNFWNEMRKIFDFICVDGVPQAKVHGLRMLDPEIVEAFPFSSGDSTTATMEATFDVNWEKYPYAPITKAGRAALVADKIERTQSPSFYEPKPIQMELI